MVGKASSRQAPPAATSAEYGPAVLLRFARFHSPTPEAVA